MNAVVTFIVYDAFHEFALNICEAQYFIISHYVYINKSIVLDEWLHMNNDFYISAILYQMQIRITQRFFFFILNFDASKSRGRQ